MVDAFTFRDPGPLKPKVARELPIPKDMHEAFAEACEFMSEMEQEPDIELDYGDAIQADGLVGGPVAPDSDEFLFTFYPDGDECRGRWHLRLTRDDMEDIAEGVVTTWPVFVCESDDCRYKWARADERCMRCDAPPEVAQRRKQLEERSVGVKSLTAWIGILLELYPNVDHVDAIGLYNGTEKLDDRFGSFTYRQMKEFLTIVRRGDEILEEPEEKTELDPSDAIAHELIDRLLHEGKLELASERTRGALASLTADLIERNVNADDLALIIEEADGVAELFVTDEEMRAMLAEVSMKVGER